MRRLTPQKLLNLCLIVVFVCLVLPLYAAKGLGDSMDHAEGTGAVGGIDFKAYYIAADMLRQGKDFYDVEEQRLEVISRGLPLNESYYVYPPLLAIAFLPLTALPMERAAQLWFFANLAFYAIALALIGRSLQLRRLTRIPSLAWILAFLFPPALFTLYKGQANILILLLLAAVYLLYRDGRSTLAGTMLALAAMVKVMPLLLVLYFMWRRKTRVVAAALTTILAIGIAGLIVVGIGPHISFLTEVMPSLTSPRPNPGNQSLAGFLGRLLTQNAYTTYYVDSVALWKILTVTSSLAVVAGMIVICSGEQAQLRRERLEIGLVITTMPLVASIAWVDTLVILVLPYAILFAHILECRSESPRLLDRGCNNLIPRWKRVVTASTVASALLVSSPRFLDTIGGLGGLDSGLLRNPLLLVSLPFYGLLILWVTCAMIIIREGALIEANHS